MQVDVIHLLILPDDELLHHHIGMDRGDLPVDGAEFLEVTADISFLVIADRPDEVPLIPEVAVGRFYQKRGFDLLPHTLQIPFRVDLH